MTGTYVLQSNRAKVNQYEVNPTCTLYGDEPEDQEHFLLRCRSLSETRDPFIRKIEIILTEYFRQDIQHEICKDANVLVAIILGCTEVDLNMKETQRDGMTSCTRLNRSPGVYVTHCTVSGLVV